MFPRIEGPNRALVGILRLAAVAGLRASLCDLGHAEVLLCKRETLLRSWAFPRRELRHRKVPLVVLKAGAQPPHPCIQLLAPRSVESNDRPDGCAVVALGIPRSVLQGQPSQHGWWCLIDHWAEPSPNGPFTVSPSASCHHMGPQSPPGAHGQGCFVPVRSTASTGFAFIVRPVWEGLGVNIPLAHPLAGTTSIQADCFCRDVFVEGS